MLISPPWPISDVTSCMIAADWYNERGQYDISAALKNYITIPIDKQNNYVKFKYRYKSKSKSYYKSWSMSLSGSKYLFLV